MKRDVQPQSDQFLNNIDNITQKNSKIQRINPKQLLTKNRDDIIVRQNFLDEIINQQQNIKKTIYYQFISDKERGIVREPQQASKNFLKLYDEIKKNNICEPILVGKYNSPILKTRYLIKNLKFWNEYENQSGYQLIDGAHRLSIALFLNLDSIPVKIITAKGFEIPDYTQFLKLKREEYLKEIGN